MSTAFPAAPAACMLIDTLKTVQFQLPSPLLVNNPPLPAIHCGIIPNPATHRKRSSERNPAPSCTRGDNLSVAMGQTAQFRHATGAHEVPKPFFKEADKSGRYAPGRRRFSEISVGTFPERVQNDPCECSFPGWLPPNEIRRGPLNLFHCSLPPQFLAGQGDS